MTELLELKVKLNEMLSTSAQEFLEKYYLQQRSLLHLTAYENFEAGFRMGTQLKNELNEKHHLATLPLKSIAKLISKTKENIRKENTQNPSKGSHV